MARRGAAFRECELLQQFDQRYVINLPERVDRRRETEAELARVRCEAAFFAAHRPATSGGFSSVGEHGAYRSHLSVWKRALGARSLLVMEDDVSFAADIEGRLPLLERLPDDWDVLYLGHMQHPSVRREWHEEGLVPIAPDVEFIGLHCYAVNGGALPRLAEAAERFLERPRGHPEGGSMPIDGALNIARRIHGFSTYAVMPPLAFQRASRTDIGALRWFDRVRALSGVVNAARRVKDRLRGGEAA